MSRRRHPPTDDPLRQPDPDDLRAELARWACPGGLLDRRRWRGLMPGQRVVLFNRETWGRYAQTWGLVSHWKLNEASGDAIDSSGTNNLADTNTVTAADGILRPGGSRSGARQFTAATFERFRLADNASLSTGDVDFAVACWAYFDSSPGGSGRTLISKWAREYLLLWNNEAAENRFAFHVSSDGAENVNVRANSLGAPATATWYFILAWHDSVGNTINIKVNNGTTDSAAHATGVFDGTAVFELGGLNDTGTYPMDGRIDEALFFKSPPGGIANKINDMSRILYNDGRGMPRN
jgi:hypothetical protein